MKDDPTLQTQVQRLYQLNVYARWLVVSALWLTVAPWSLWTLRREIGLWLEYFTWSVVRYGLAYHRLAAVGLGLCLGVTTAVLVWQSSNILWGLPPEQQRRLERQVRHIRDQGASHPLWKWVCRGEDGL
jgi:hypothetical protein